MTDLDAAGTRLSQADVEPTPPIADVLAARTRRRRRQRTGRTAVAVLAVAAVIGAVVAVWPGHRSREDVTTTGPGVTGLATGHWSNLPPGPMDGRLGSAVTWAGTGLFVWGGANSAGRVVPGGAMYDPSTRTWSSVPAGPLSPREAAAAVWTGTQVIVWGGGGGTIGPAVPLADSDGAAYNPTTHRWNLLPAAPPGIVDGNAAWTGSRLVIFGESGELASYDPTTARWTSIAPPTDESAGFHWGELLPVGDTVFAVANFSGSCSCDFPTSIWALDAADHWSKVPQAPTPLAGQVQVLASDTGLLTVQQPGVFRPQPSDGLAQLYNPTTGQWTSVPSPNPAATTPDSEPQAAAWTGTDFVSFYLSPDVLNRGPAHLIGGALNPRTDQWVALPLSPSLGPVEGSLPEAFWTGHQLLVWTPTGPHTGLILSPG